MQALFSALFAELVDRAEAYVRFDSANYLCAKLHTPNDDPDLPLISADQVPVFTSRSPYALSNLPWDISILHLIPFIDGFSCVHKLSLEAAMDVECVKCCLRVLRHYGCILMSDIFQFSNSYSLTDSARSLLTSSIIAPTSLKR
jgi:hypothetical protein